MKKSVFCFLFCGIAAVSFVSCTKSTSETSYDKKSYVEVAGLKWATKNVGATADNPYGNVYTYEQALHACPDGWRLPTSDELWLLSLLHSVPVIYDGMNGMWFSGSIPYKDGVDAVFFPAAGRDCGSGKEGIDTYGYYWSSTVDRSGYYAYLLCFYISEGIAAMGFESDSGENSVRCVKD